MAEGVLNKLFDDAVQTLWPGVRSHCEFRPSLDLTEGHFSTDFCIKLSSELNTPPQELGGKLLGALRALDGVTLAQNHGFINASFESARICEEYFRSQISILPCEETVIIIPPYLPNASPIAYLRNASLAWEQFLLLKNQGAECMLCLGAYRYPDDRLLHGYRDMLLRLEYPENIGTAEALGHIRSALSEAGSCRVFLWFCNDSLPKADFQSFYREAIHRQPRHILRCPDPNWCMSSEKFELPVYLKEAQGKQLFSLLLYLCGETPASDLDFLVPRFSENANLLWFLSSLLQRIERISRCGEGGEPLDQALCSAGAPTLSPKLALFCAQYPFFVGRCCSHGELESYNQMLRQQAGIVNAGLNQPALRRALCAASDHAEAEIIYSVSRIFSAIISWCY